MINTNPNNLACDYNNVQDIFETYALKGSIVEFGTMTGTTTTAFACQFPNTQIFTIDHFQGLEKTNKALPHTSDWRQGAFRNDNYQEVLANFANFPNIKMILSDIHALTEPADYGIEEVGFCHIDVDIYEPTVSALEFISKTTWDRLFIRFDDWHGGEAEYDQHERLAFAEWIEKYDYEYEIVCGGVWGGVIVTKK